MSKNISEPGSRNQALLQLLRTSETIWNASRLFFAQWDLSPSQFNVLNLLHGMDEGRTQIELSRELITHRSNVTGLVDRLEKRGLVHRQAVPGDRRAYHVLLTPAGRKLIDEILPEYHERTENALGGIPLKQLSLLKQQLKTIEDTASVVAANLSNQ